MENIIKYEDFTKVDIRLGTIVDAEEYGEIKNPSIKLEIDFGNEIGVKKSSAQITTNYNLDEISLSLLTTYGINWTHSPPY